MTTTTVAGLPAELRAVLARAGMSQEQACDEGDLSRSTYYRRVRTPGTWTLAELETFLAAAGYTLHLDLRMIGETPPAHERAPLDDSVAGLGGLSG